MTKIICVAGPYHGQRIEGSSSDGRISVDGARGQITYILRGQPAPNIAVYVPEGATEVEIRVGFVDLASVAVSGLARPPD